MKNKEYSSPHHPNHLWRPYNLLLNGYMSSFPGERQPELEAGQIFYLFHSWSLKLAKCSIYFKVKKKVKLFFIPLDVCMVFRSKYLNGKGSGCPAYRMLEPGGGLSAVLYLGCMLPPLWLDET
jgi:hypothetical protein